ncbi:uncharacterized protein LOC115386012 isoform X2 [Salarias fasciatus]|uniref:uncharacterized protein LOC115386012 isoform X2 n=1 Tax=Salarias fasciatus TaxID=181472 RepID=UPI001176F160|nr:uncharacterized protein LOC115386012 isoform X2 [Salarias fasciatus]
MESKGIIQEENGRKTECEEDQRESTPEEKRFDPDDPTLIIVDEEDQLDFELDNFPSPRALMSCGHAVTPTSLTNWCRRQLDQCPGCQSTVLRSDFTNLCVECTWCTRNHRRPFFLCWQCLREWRGPSPRTDGCDNRGCSDKSLETLKNCPDMTFLEVEGVTGCPSIRACPSCGFLLGHDQTGCKFLLCPQCGEDFCFVCLKNTDDCCETSDPYDPCSGGVAPRQTSIPSRVLFLHRSV